MPNKLTDTEIKKALEWHLNEVNHCDGCPLFVLKNTTTYCVDVLMQNALDLINRQEAEIKHLDIESDILRADVENLNRINDELNAENESLKAEVERLKKVNDSFTDVGKLYSEIKAEAYKEFAERLKEKMVKHNFKYADTLFSANVATAPMVDNLLNEFIGE